MEVISLHIDVISRSKGRSAIQMAAYCARDKLYSDYTGKSYDYTNRQDLVYHDIMLPDYAPDDFHNSEVLWNSVEKVEKSKNAQLARSVIIALPKELVIVPISKWYVSMHKNILCRKVCVPTYPFMIKEMGIHTPICC